MVARQPMLVIGLFDIRNLAAGLESCAWVHVFREANRVAYAFARRSMDMDPSLHVFDVVSSFAYFPLLYDASFVNHQRGS